MATTTTSPSCTFIDTAASLAAMIPNLTNLPTNPPSLYIDLEGVQLSRHGTISILQIYVLPQRHTYLLDIHILGSSAFTPALKSLLESPSVPKCLFDVRRDADALYNLFGVSLQGVWDLQLMELATRPGRKQCVNGLARCIRTDAGMGWNEVREFEARKQQGLELFAPEKGGSYEVFNERPVKKEIVEYCVQDVEFLPKLWMAYKKRLTPGWARKLESATEERLALARSKTFMPDGRNMALGPW
ncbi:ribonuclease H-like domain-containing protein [Trichophaea hybrida]|nr:ribonuclease H-like domain-containing protein [Trichophaea hybrida]